MNQDIEKVKDVLKSSKDIVVLTGAGVSQESGVPTFRDKDGLWRNYDLNDLATPEGFERNPKLVWEWYNWRRGIISNVRPNPAHFAIKKLEGRSNNFTLITQNIDGLHHLAGNRNILELHGNIWQVLCTKCKVVTENRDIPIEILPYCKNCGRLLRPNVVWFGEFIPQDVLKKAVYSRKNCDFMLVIGTSSIVYPAASFAISVKMKNAYVVEINLSKTPLTEFADMTIFGKAGEILPKIVMGEIKEIFKKIEKNC